jgi:hypothetical protein
MRGKYSRKKEMKNPYYILIGKAEGKRFSGRPAHRWEDNINIDFKEIVWESLYLIQPSSVYKPVCGHSDERCI